MLDDNTNQIPTEDNPIFYAIQIALEGESTYRYIYLATDEAERDTYLADFDELVNSGKPYINVGHFQMRIPVHRILWYKPIQDFRRWL